MNFFRALGYVNITGSVPQALLIFLLIFIPGLNIVGIPIVLGYMVRAIPEIIDGAPDMPSFSFMGFIADFARGLATVIMGALYFVPMIVMVILLNNLLFSKGYLTISDKNFLVLMAFILSTVSFVFLSVGMIRFALTTDVRAYLQLRGNIGLSMTHFRATFLFVFNVLVSLSLLGMGFITCFLPGLLFYPIWVFVLCYLMARYASDLGLASMKIKRKNDLLYAPRAEPEKQKQG